MKILLSALVVLAGLNHAVALPNFEPFADATANGGTSYTVGSGLVTTTDGQTNGANTWISVFFNNAANGSPTIVGGNLSYPDLPASTGNSVAFIPASGMSARLGLSASPAPSVAYYSFILKITDISSVLTTAANNAFAAFSDTVAAPQAATLARSGGKLVTKKSGAGYVLGVGKGTATADYVYDSTIRNVSDVLFVVVSYERAGGTTNINLWVNPPSASFGDNSPPAPTAAMTSGAITGDMNQNGVRSFVILCQNTTAPSGIIDDVRVGRTWAFVTGGPEIGTQPANLTRNAGTAAVLSGVSGGTPPLSYQWQRAGTNLADGGNISGATTPTLTISNLLQADADAYTLVVTNSYGSTTSSVATLTVIDPAILSQPASQTLPPGANAVFQAVAAGTGPLSYLWFKDSINALADGGNISGANTATLTVTSVSPNDVGGYSVFVTNSLGNFIQSSNAALTITDPAITSPPQNRTNDFGTTATFQVSVSGTSPFSYQWHKSGVGDLADGGNVSGSQSNLLTLTNVSYLDAASYYVTVTNSAGSADSGNAVLTVRDPMILTNPVSMTASDGSTVLFSVLATGSPTLTYQWQRSATNIFDGGNWSGTASDTLTIANISSVEGGTYRVVVTGGSGNSATSSNAILTVLSPVAITSQPVSQTDVVSGTNVTFAVSATGTAPLHYQWQHDDVNIPNANLSTYTILGVQTNDAGAYTVVITNSINAVTSAPASLTVVMLPPTISAQPNSRTIAPGTRAAFVVGASGSLPLGYQWQRDGFAIAGANSLLYVITNVQSAHNAVYTVVVSNSVNSITSAPAVLTVTANLPLSQTNLVAVRVGDGEQALALTGNSVFLDQFTTSGAYVNTISIPDRGASALIATGLDLTGTTLTGMALTRSPDKRFLVIGGYHADVPYSGNLNGAASTAVPRGVGLIDSSGQFTLVLSDTNAYSGAHFRAAAYDGAGNFWGAGSGQGTYYFGTNAAAGTIQNAYNNLRMVDIFGTNLFCLSSASGNSGLLKFDDLPTVPSAANHFLPGFSSANTTDFAFDPSGTLVYLTVGSTVQKWQFDGTTWTNAYAITNFPALARYLTVDFGGAAPVLYVDTADGRIMSVVDIDSSSIPTTLITSGCEPTLQRHSLWPGWHEHRPAHARAQARRKQCHPAMGWRVHSPIGNECHRTLFGCRRSHQSSHQQHGVPDATVLPAAELAVSPKSNPTA